MVRTKIEINVSALGKTTKTMNMVIGSNTTAADVIRKVLEKFRMRESPTKFQLLTIAKNDAGSQGMFSLIIIWLQLYRLLAVRYVSTLLFHTKCLEWSIM